MVRVLRCMVLALAESSGSTAWLTPFRMGPEDARAIWAYLRGK